MIFVLAFAEILLLIFLGAFGFSSKPKTTTVRKIAPLTKQETVEIHEHNGQDSLKKAARIVFWVLLIPNVLFLILAVISVIFYQSNSGIKR